jgi:hypothetical protein
MVIDHQHPDELVRVGHAPIMPTRQDRYVIRRSADPVI